MHLIKKIVYSVGTGAASYMQGPNLVSWEWWQQRHSEVKATYATGEQVW